MENRLQILLEKSIFNDAQMCNMVDPCIFTTPAFKQTEEAFNAVIQKRPTYICDIWKLKYWVNVIFSYFN